MVGPVQVGSSLLSYRNYTRLGSRRVWGVIVLDGDQCLNVPCDGGSQETVARIACEHSTDFGLMGFRTKRREAATIRSPIITRAEVIRVAAKEGNEVETQDHRNLMVITLLGKGFLVSKIYLRYYHYGRSYSRRGHTRNLRLVAQRRKIRARQFGQVTTPSHADKSWSR